MKATSPPPLPRDKQFPCVNCGAHLQFVPGTNSLVCPYCGTNNPIPAKFEVIEELDFREHLARLERGDALIETLTVTCDACGAQTTLDPNVTAGRCPFCASPIVTSAAHSQRQIRPRSLLPFHISHKQAMDSFRRWLEGLWFAPSDLRRRYEDSGINGIYLPAWTYDADTESDYTGQRGEDYWTTESYWTTENGRRVMRTRQVKKTRWYYVSGRVRNVFDDVLVMATTSLPRHLLDKLEPWDLSNLVPYQEHYLAGFVAQSYQVDLQQGFAVAAQIMDGYIRQSIRRDIGGDHQRIHSVNTHYYAITFKHILLPVWLSAYRYRGKSFHFVVNARTGEVQGERPYSWLKITLFVALIAAVVMMIVLFLFNGGIDM